MAGTWAVEPRWETQGLQSCFEEHGSGLKGYKDVTNTEDTRFLDLAAFHCAVLSSSEDVFIHDARGRNPSVLDMVAVFQKRVMLEMGQGLRHV